MHFADIKVQIISALPRILDYLIRQFFCVKLEKFKIKKNVLRNKSSLK